jgi:hypothetical protein
VATTLDTVIRRAMRRYGLAPNAEDALLNQNLMVERVNELLQELADEGAGFREEFTLNLSSSTGVHALSSRVIRIEDGTVRIDYAGDGLFSTRPRQVEEPYLRRLEGSLEYREAGTPSWYYTQRGTVADAMLALVLYPQSNTARTGGLKLWARSYPAALVVTTDTLPLQLGEERFLIPGICLALAEVECSRGRRDAPLQYWASRWQQALTDFADVVEDGSRGNRRRIHFGGDDC